MVDSAEVESTEVDSAEVDPAEVESAEVESAEVVDSAEVVEVVGGFRASFSEVSPGAVFSFAINETSVPLRNPQALRVRIDKVITRVRDPFGSDLIGQSIANSLLNTSVIPLVLLMNSINILILLMLSPGVLRAGRNRKEPKWVRRVVIDPAAGSGSVVVETRAETP